MLTKRTHKIKIKSISETVTFWESVFRIERKTARSGGVKPSLLNFLVTKTNDKKRKRKNDFILGLEVKL